MEPQQPPDLDQIADTIAGLNPAQVETVLAKAKTKGIAAKQRTANEALTHYVHGDFSA